MFGLFKKKTPAATPDPALRDALFADYPWVDVLAISAKNAGVEPWASFARAKGALDRGEKDEAIAQLHAILATPELESRIALQAWHFLRELGVQPPADVPKELLGVVVEVGLPGGADLVAAYADHRARYWNFSGAGVVWERPNDQLDADLDRLLATGLTVLHKIGPWTEARPPAPTNGVVRINLLSPSGLHFGQGPWSALQQDEMAGPVLQAALEVMQKLMQLPK